MPLIPFNSYHFSGKPMKMNDTIIIEEKDVYKKSYRIRKTGREGSSLETTIPREVFEREARRVGLTVEEAIQKLVAVWRFNSFRGLHLTFEPKENQRKKG